MRDIINIKFGFIMLEFPSKIAKGGIRKTLMYPETSSRLSDITDRKPIDSIDVCLDKPNNRFEECSIRATQKDMVIYLTQNVLIGFCIARILDLFDVTTCPLVFYYRINLKPEE